LTPSDLDVIIDKLRKAGAAKAKFIVLDQVLKEGQWSPKGESVISYKCDFCGAPIIGIPYIVDLGSRILIFTNRKCADAYFKLRRAS